MDFNAAEIVVLLLLAIVIFGPEKLPELARKTARVLNYVRGIANDARGQLRQELGPEFADLKLSDLNPGRCCPSTCWAPRWRPSCSRWPATCAG
ncbi:MAG: Sec-independent protein translocase subunit TatB [Micropruina sp.]|nr:MAG: Sec-independent protein translocase subunit TatB [Micropruina sp.]